MVIKNKKGWIKIIEAFTAILLIAGVMLLVISKGDFAEQNPSQKIYKAELLILKEIQLDENLRSDVLNTNPVPAQGDDVPENIRNKINSRKPANLDCTAKICLINEVCTLEDFPLKDVYVQSVVISANQEIYNPRQVKLFCWSKN